MAELIALATTLVIEGGGMALAAWALPGWRTRWRTAVLLALGLNLVSHTLFWHSLARLGTVTPTVLLTSELIVTAVEGAVYAATVARPRWTGWLVSLGLNWASWGLSAYIWSIFVW